MHRLLTRKPEVKDFLRPSCSIPYVISAPVTKMCPVLGHLCVPKTSSVLIAGPNRLNVGGDDRAALVLPDPVRLAVQVEEPT